MGRLVLEKLPFFGSRAAFSAVASIAQSHGAPSLRRFLCISLMNAVVVYAIYLRKSLLPINLAVYYPHPGFTLGWTKSVGSGVVLLAITAFARVHLVADCHTVRGLVLVSRHIGADDRTHPDRRSADGGPLYVFSFDRDLLGGDMACRGVGARRSAQQTGFFPAPPSPSSPSSGRFRSTRSVIGAIRSACSATRLPSCPSIRHLTSIWGPRTCMPTFRRKRSPTRNRHPARAAYRPLQYKLADALEKVGRSDEAFKHYQAALGLDETSAKTHNDFAVLLMSRHRDAEAGQHLERAIELDPDLANAQANLSLLCARPTTTPARSLKASGHSSSIRSKSTAITTSPWPSAGKGDSTRRSASSSCSSKSPPNIRSPARSSKSRGPCKSASTASPRPGELLGHLPHSGRLTPLAARADFSYPCVRSALPRSNTNNPKGHRLSGSGIASRSDEPLIAVFIDFENLAIGVRGMKTGDSRIQLVLKRLLEKGGSSTSGPTATGATTATPSASSTRRASS